MSAPLLISRGLLDLTCLTCCAARKRREGGNNQLVGEVHRASICVAGVSQGGEADQHWVGAGTGAAKPAHLTGVWNRVDAIRPTTTSKRDTRLRWRDVCYSLVTCSTWHTESPTWMEAFSWPKPVPVTTSKVPRPFDPAKSSINKVLAFYFRDFDLKKKIAQNQIEHLDLGWFQSQPAWSLQTIQTSSRQCSLREFH